MQLQVNGATYRTDATDLAALATELAYSLDDIACAIDGDFVARSQYGDTPLKDGLRIEILTAMQGG